MFPTHQQNAGGPAAPNLVSEQLQPDPEHPSQAGNAQHLACYLALEHLECMLKLLQAAGAGLCCECWAHLKSRHLCSWQLACCVFQCCRQVTNRVFLLQTPAGRRSQRGQDSPRGIHLQQCAGLLCARALCLVPRGSASVGGALPAGGRSGAESGKSPASLHLQGL